MDRLTLEMAKARENRPGLRKSRLIIEIAHESDEVHEEMHDAAVKAACSHNGVIFLGGLSDGDPFDHEPEENNNDEE
jgi:hypothetical protein